MEQKNIDEDNNYKIDLYIFYKNLLILFIYLNKKKNLEKKNYIFLNQ